MDDRKNLPEHEALIRRVSATLQNQFAEFTEKKLLYLTKADETDNLWALTCDGNTWVRGDDEAEQAFIDRASADARKQQRSHRIAMLLQTDPPRSR